MKKHAYRTINMFSAWKGVFLFVLISVTGCGTLTPEAMFEAVKIRDDQCGTAQIKGNMDVGGTLGFFGTTVVVDINKEKRTYVDASGNVKDC